MPQADRADLENRVAVERPRITLVQISVRDDARPLWPDHAHRDADALVLNVDSIAEDLPDFRIRWHRWFRNSLRNRARSRGPNQRYLEHTNGSISS